MNPSTGSFTTMDSYQGSLYEPATLHKYAYANANPVSNIDPSGYTATSLSECTIVEIVQKGIKDIVQIQKLRKVMSWANVACTTYDICVALREVFLNDADSSAIFQCILRGMIIDVLVDCLLGGHVKTIAKALIACKELGDQVDTIRYDIEQGDFISAGVHAVHLIVMIFSIMAQCFTGETEVMTDEGLIAIEDIEVGDYVLAEDTVTGEQEYKEVLNVFVSQTNKLVHVTTADKNSETNTETNINTTDNHPFYVVGKGWVPAIELEVGDELRTANGEIETVSKVEVEYLDEPVLIYNLEVEGYHTYFVSDESVLVHNGCGTNGEGNGNSKGGNTSKIGDFSGLNGSNVDDILDRIPDDAVLRELTPVNGGATEGFEFKWIQDGQTYRVRVHNPDPSAPIGTNAYNNWVVRVQRGRQYYDYTIDGFQPAKFTNSNGDFFDESIMNNTHIPIQNPYD